MTHGPNLSTRNCTKFIWSTLEKYFVDLFKLFGQFRWHFFTNISNFVDLFSFFSNFVDLFSLFGHFVDLLGLVSPVTCTEIPLRTKNFAVLMRQVQCKPYYAGHRLQFLKQSHYSARHIWHNVYFFPPHLFNSPVGVSQSLRSGLGNFIEYGEA